MFIKTTLIISFIFLTACNFDNNLLGSGDGKAKGDNAPTVVGNNTFSISVASRVGVTAKAIGNCIPGEDVVFSSPALNPSPQSIACDSSGEYLVDLMFASGTDDSVGINVTNGGLEEVISIYVDTVAPLDPVIVSPADGVLISSLAQVISGTCNSGERVFVSGDIDPSPLETLCSGNSYSFDIDIVPGDGPKVLSVYQEDSSGNQSNMIVSNIILDTTLPLVAITNAAVINLANVSSYGVSGTCSENTRAVVVSVGGINVPGVTCNSGLWSVTGLNISAAADAANLIITANHTDTVGNNAVQAIENVLKDTMAPMAPVVIVPAPGSNLNSVNTTVIGGNCEEGDIVTVSGDINPSPRMMACSGGQYSIPVTLTTGDGVKNFAVSQADQAGNPSSVTNVSTNLDQTAPTGLSITVPLNNTFTNTRTQVVTGTCEANAVVSLTGDFTPSPAMATCSGGGAYSISINLTAQEGAKNIQAIQTDAAGNNSSVVSISVSLDISIPTVTINTPLTSINVDNQPGYIVEGTCSEDSRVVNVSVGGVSPSTQPTCIGGNWSTIGFDVSGLADSSMISVIADHSDAAGNSAAQASANVSKDAAIPAAVVISSPSNSDNINSSALTINGTCESGASVSLSGDFTPSPSVVSCVSGSYNSSVTLTAGDGVKNISASQEDPSGNTSAATPITVNLDTTDPTDPTITAPIGSVSGQSHTAMGSCETGAIVSISGDITPSPVTGICTAGSYSIAIELIAPDGTKNLSVIQEDSSGNTSNAVAGTVILDTTVPTVSITIANSINDGNKTTYSLSGTCSEDTRQVSIVVGITSPVPQPTCTSGLWSVTNLDVSTEADSLTLGITADHNDAALNSAVQASKSVVKDTVVPVGLTMTSPSGGTTTNSTALNITGACETGSTVDINGDFTPSPTSIVCSASAYSVAVTLTTGDGLKNASVTQTDGGGNQSAVVMNSITFDSTVPTVAITTPLANINSSNETAFTINGTCSENTRTVTVDIGGITPGVQPTCTTNTWAVTIDVSALADSGTVIAAVSHTDLAGNTGSDSARTIKDSTNPAVVTVASPVNGSSSNTTSQVITGNCESGSTVTLTGDFTPSPATGSCSGGSYSIPVSLNTGDGTKNINATQTDIFDNTSAGIVSSIVLDTVTPTGLTIATPTNGSGANSIVQTVTGVCEANAQIQITGDISPTPVMGTCTGGGTYSISSVFLSAGDGSKTINATQTDAAGNISAAVSTVVTLDTSTPAAITITSPANGANVGMTAQTITGTCETGLTVTLSGDITSSPVTGTCSAGSYSIAVVLITPDGSKSLSATQGDAGGNTSPATNLILNLNTSPPVITMITPNTDGDADGWFESGDSISFEVEFDQIVNVSGVPNISLGLTTGNILLNYVSGTGTKKIVFTTSIPVDSYSCSSAHTLNALNLNGGTIKSVAGIDSNNSSLPTSISGFMVDAKKPTGDFGVLDITANDGGIDRSVTTTWVTSPTDECGISDYSFAVGSHDGSVCSDKTAIAPFKNFAINTTFQAISGTVPYDVDTFSVAGLDYCSTVVARDGAGNTGGETSSNTWNIRGYHTIGGAFQKVPTSYNTNCQEVLDDPLYNGQGDGAYWIDPDGASTAISPLITYCDMDGAIGWTLAASTSASNFTMPIVTGINSTSFNGILSAAVIAELGNSAVEVRINSTAGEILEVKSTNSIILNRFKNYETLSDPGPTCDTSIWTGATTRLACGCNGSFNGLNNTVYHACNIGSNLHWLPYVDSSGWVFKASDEMNLWVR